MLAKRCLTWGQVVLRSRPVLYHHHHQRLVHGHDFYLQKVFQDTENLLRFRTILYPESKDPRVQALNKAVSGVEVLETLQQIPQESWTVEHTSQACATLFHLCRVCDYVYKTNRPEEHDLSQHYAKAVIESDMFEKVMENLLQKLNQLPDQDLAYSLMSLRRLRLLASQASGKRDNDKLNDCITHVQTHLQSKLQSLDPVCLSLMASSFRATSLTMSMENVSLECIMSLAPAMSKMLQALEKAQTLEELHKITIFMIFNQAILNVDFLDKFATRVTHVLQSVTKPPPDPEDESLQQYLKAMSKIIAASLTNVDWFESNLDYRHLVLSSFRGLEHLLRIEQVMSLFFAIRPLKEPVDVYTRVLDRLYQAMELERGMNLTMLSLLSKESIVVEIKPIDKTVIELAAEKTRNVKMIRDVVDLLKLVKMQAPEFAQLLESKFRSGFSYNDHFLIEICQQYMRLDYQSPAFEEFLIKNFEETISQTMRQWAFSGKLAFLILFDKKPVDEESLDRFLYMCPNLQARSLVIITAGMKRYKRHLKSKMQKAQFDLAIKSVTRRAMELLETSEGSAVRENFRLLKTFVNLHKYLPIEVVGEAIALLMDRSFISNLYAMRMAFASLDQVPIVVGIDNTVDQMMAQVLDKKAHVNGFLATVAIITCFNSNCKIHNKDFLQLVNDIIIRDFALLKPSYLFKACLALVKYNAFSPELCQMIFCESYMKKLDDKMSLTSSHHFVMVGSRLMELNRAVCLLYPEYQVPWFNELFCDKFPPRRRSSKEVQIQKQDVFERLCNAVGGNEYVRTNTRSPYFNNIDFEVILNRSGQPLAEKEADLANKDSQDLHKLAVIVFDQNNICQPTNKLSGSLEMELELLELQGYEVLPISPFKWNSMSMNNKTKSGVFQEVIDKLN